MDWQLFFLTFGTVFLSELGDKSQLATLSISSNSKALRYVFLGSASALLLSSLIGVLLGDSMAEIIPTKFLKAIAAAIFAFMAIKVLE
ncbi:putative membrane protein [Synechococcus sp. PCC 7502]|uniref:TMEM165/GDT1 family protein n=1 Tax=Synechococcus sp. PCC 7502 TaxID=1173263 RepID=UPI00029F8219|nr:TMEM165/GDT1 family protein [Synechococcus sp. PCC 7502]AFY73751.1 putative membrane protein [Synechococcus sp. PCC 7502]